MLRELFRFAERDPEKFMAAARETWESLSLPDREPFNPGHRCGPKCWHKQVPSWDPQKSAEGAIKDVVRAAARFAREKLL